MINKKGLTDKKIQELIDWSVECSKFDKGMWEMTAQRMIRDEILTVLDSRSTTRKGMSSQGINISQVFDEELAKITDKNITDIFSAKNITDICKKQKT